MGLDIRAAAHCQFEADCSQTELFSRDDLLYIEGAHFPERLDGFQPGFYRFEARDEFAFRVGPYSFFYRWRQWLCQLALGVPLDAVHDNPDTYTGQPFFELLVLGDDAGAIGPQTSRKLYADFVAFQEKAEQHETEADDRESFIEQYNHWKMACFIARQNGFVELG
ncbi:hypothetical protein EON80_18665 [bacterium]|nr:MAG: hypothetical protein EON80_18665 [bacterium]